MDWNALDDKERDLRLMIRVYDDLSFLPETKSPPKFGARESQDKGLSTARVIEPGGSGPHWT